ncbi:tyrosine-type recombinase/integrase [Candidatus Sulfurimonas baltica]|uniref:Site-specific integrase n=1 Tax=Candidatus Sulfurimonas baltica TaxID=2740404 RepID=A0A7S7RM36_9BACT|nr:site-specific integrase [Candidatus Sulfurimonas baltica]QOY50910.1 site-specific integrase [Candidatus Sulfurimonas baltica]
MRLLVNIYLTILGVKFTIKEKYNRWYIAFSHNGRRINRSTGLEASKKNLQTVKKEVLPQIAQELISSTQSVDADIRTSDETLLEDFSELHFNLHKENVRSHVYERDFKNFQRHILPYFKSRQLTSIKPMELEAWQNRLLLKYKILSVQKYRSIFYGIFTRAYKNELVTKNPFDTVTAPKMKGKFNRLSKSEAINPFTQKEINILVDADDNSYMSNYIKLMSNSGIRPGELIALTWKDIDFENRTINVDKTIINNVSGLPKTQSSVRVVDIIQDAYEALEAQYKLTATLVYVFVNSSHKRFYSHDIININFRNRLKMHNIEVRPLYQLRHSFASRMIKSGINITWVSAMLGHKDSSITLQVYTKFIQEDNETRMSNIDKINQQLGGEAYETVTPISVS